MAINHPYIFIYGGITFTNFSNELWVYDLTTQTFSLLGSSSSQAPPATASSNCLSFTQNQNVVFRVMFGRIESFDP